MTTEIREPNTHHKEDKAENINKAAEEGSRKPPLVTRRTFFKGTGGLTLGAAGLSFLGGATPILATEEASACMVGPFRRDNHRSEAFQVRLKTALFQKNLPHLRQPANNDEGRYRNKVASFSKTLPHNDLGEVNLFAYRTLLAALFSSQSRGFEEIPLGGEVKLVNPQD
ncbi:MAG: hypothetical protein ACMUIA_04940, partial [bacterium]